MRAVLLVGLRRLEAVLDYIDDAKARVELRRFLKAHPDVTIRHWTDGT